MILSAPEIVRRLDLDSASGRLVIRPYSRESQQPASYDLRAADETRLARGTCTLLPTLEWVELPMDLAGTKWDSSTILSPVVLKAITQSLVLSDWLAPARLRLGICVEIGS
jgi:deoxycytidine triphosphate deaminase